MMMAATLLSFLLPLAGAIVLGFSGGRLGPRASAAIGVGSVGLAALATAWALLTFSGDSQGFTLWTWVSVGEFQPTMGVVVDRLSLVMMSIITGVGFLIHLFAVW